MEISVFSYAYKNVNTTRIYVHFSNSLTNSISWIIIIDKVKAKISTVIYLHIQKYGGAYGNQK